MRASAKLSALLFVVAATAIADANVARSMPAPMGVFGAGAHRSADCQAMIADLITTTQPVGITGRNADKDRAGLVGKLDNASADLAAGKNADAIQKLNDFVNKVGQLLDAGKIGADDAANLVAGANAVILCIQELS